VEYHEMMLIDWVEVVKLDVDAVTHVAEHRRLAAERPSD
jgi:hypothetical protein